MEWYKVAFGELYPVVYSRRDDEEAARVAARMKAALAARAPVLDVACGNGRYMSALRHLGFDAYGVDLSEFLLDDAVATRHLGGRVVCGDMRALPFADASVGAVINMFTSFGYFDADLDNVRVAREMARVLAPGGRLFLDFMNAGLVAAEPVAHSLRRESGAVVEEWREVTGRFVEKHVRVTPDRGEPVEYRERVRLYSLDALLDVVAESGLVVCETHGDYDLSPFRAGASPRAIVVAEKPGQGGSP